MPRDLGNLVRRRASMTLGLVVAGVGLVSAVLIDSEFFSKSARAEPLVLPSVAWSPLPPARTPLTRIGFGSCLHQNRDQPIWRSVIAAKPELFLMVGDNVYGDIKSADRRELTMAYAKLAKRPEFAAARQAFPILAIWDDHDYGGNDAGGDFVHRAAARKLFRTFWKGSGSVVGQDPVGIFYAAAFGPVGQRVQIIMLDTRSFRSPLRRKSVTDFGKGRYVPDPSPEKTLLGERQWRWLAAELKKPADVRLIVSSIQILAQGHRWERWGNLPLERNKLFALIRRVGANGVILLSGDRHRASIYRTSNDVGYPLYEVTSSSMNLPFADPEESGPYQLDQMYGGANFGVLQINWPARSVDLTIRDIDGQIVRSRRVELAKLAVQHR